MYEKHYTSIIYDIRETKRDLKRNKKGHAIL